MGNGIDRCFARFLAGSGCECVDSDDYTDVGRTGRQETGDRVDEYPHTAVLVCLVPLV